MSKLRYALETGSVRCLLAAARVLPRRPLLALGGLAGRVQYLLDGSRRDVTLSNLRLAYGDELSPVQARRIAHACWRNLGRNLAQTLFFPRVGPDAVGKRVHYAGLEHIRRAYARGQGVLLFSAHFGHWELTALMQGHLGMPLLLVTRPLDNPSLERLLADLRSRSGNRVVHKRNAGREMLRALREGLGVAIVIDQDALNDGVFVPFFGHPASTTPTLARLALRSRAAVVPTFSVPQDDGSYRVVYEPEVAVTRSGDLEADTRRLTAECTAIVERWVRRYPEHWFWMHRRWKTPAPAQRAIFLDRDGTISEEVGHLANEDDLRLLPRSAAALRLAVAAGFRTVLVTNQSGVARGYFDEATLARVHARLEQLLRDEGAGLDRIYYCPHHPEAAVEALRRNCDCRKPQPGMLLRAGEELRLNLEASYMIGDHPRDVEAGVRAGAQGILVLTGHGRAEFGYHARLGDGQPAYVAEDLLDAVEWIVRQEKLDVPKTTHPETRRGSEP